MKFQPVFINATTIDDGWHQILINLNRFGRAYTITDGSHAGEDRLVFDHVSGFIHYPHNRPLAVQMPEGLGLDPPTTEEVIEEYFTDYLMNPTLGSNEEYKYASWVIGGNDICPTPQLNWVIRHFREVGYGNEHCTIRIGNHDSNLAYDRFFFRCPKCKSYYPRGSICVLCRIPTEPDETKRGTSPCLVALDFRMIEGFLSTHVIYRSWDAFGGWPTNIAGFTLLNEFVAGLLGVQPGPLSFSCKSLHIYSHHLKILLRRLHKES
jgi:hypothetical protein